MSQAACQDDETSVITAWLETDDGRHDAALCTHFHKRNLRMQMLNGPEGSAMARHIPIQSFDK